MRLNLLVAAFVASALAAPVADPEPATPAGYGTKTVTVTAGPVANTRSSTSTTKSSTSTKKSSTSTTKSSTSAKATSTTKKSSTTSKATVTVNPVSTSKKTTSTSVKASTTSKVAAAVPTTLEQIAIYHHNIHRSNHSASNVVWSPTLASIAASIASNCVYAHNVTAGGGGYGQNIAAGVKADNISDVITDLFYNGEMPYYNGLYGEAQPSYDNFAHWGHFSQIVWKDTKSIGCAVQHCSNGLANTGGNIPPYFTVCNYHPAGNYGGEYADNIGKPLGHAVAHWNTGL